MDSPSNKLRDCSVAISTILSFASPLDLIQIFQLLSKRFYHSYIPHAYPHDQMLIYKGPNSFYYLDTQLSLKQLSTMPIVNWSKLTDIHWEQPVKKKTEMRLKWTKCIQVNERWVYFIGGEIEGMDKASAFCRRLDLKGRVMQIREWMKAARLCFGITFIRDSIYVMGGNNGAFESL